MQRDGRQRLIFALDLDAFFGFDRLVQTVGPAAALHQAPGEIVDDDDFAFLHDVMMVELVERVRFQSLLDAVQHLHVRRVVKIADAEQAFGFVNALFGQHGRVLFFVNQVIAGRDFCFLVLVALVAAAE